MAVQKKGGHCRDDWHSWENQAACGFHYDAKNNYKKIFDSQVSRANF